MWDGGAVLLWAAVACCLVVGTAWLVQNAHINRSSISWLRPRLDVHELIVDVDAALARLPAKRTGLTALRGRSFGVVSDIHYEGDDAPTVDPALLAQAVAAINAERLDGVFLLGDYVQKDARHASALLGRYLRNISCTAAHGSGVQSGVYGVLGNHDDAVDVRQRLEAGGHVRLLENETMQLAPGVALVGLGDLNRRRFRPDAVVEQIAASDYVIVLSHNPDTARLLSDDPLWADKIDLQLSGHTHGAQLAFPLLGSPLPAVSYLVNRLPLCLRLPLLRACGFINVLRYDWSWLAGTHVVRSNTTRSAQHTLHVTCGLGSHFGVRLGVAPQLTLLRFR